jgi:hypothetical protein
MTRLDAEHHRLYRVSAPASSSGEADSVRAAVLTLSSPADWSLLSLLWRGVQTDLGLPAPAIAVSGRDGYQLWFSFANALPATQAQELLRALQARYLGEVAPRRISTLPASATHELELPPLQTSHEVSDERWSAFVAPDLAPVFADTPWLDTPPSPEGQADLLSRLRSISADEWQVARTELGLNDRPETAPAAPAAQAAQGPAAQPQTAAPGPHLAEQAARPGEPVSAVAASPLHPEVGPTDPRAFLQTLMNDPSVALALRIEAAKALL